MLNDFVIFNRVNQKWRYSGMDSIDQCRDPDHFKSYPYSVEYNYNSRGFRDDEWPQDLTDAVWCLGDSFTVGLGAPREHTWPYLLQQRIGHKCINLGMDGGSNNWMARRACEILNEQQPKLIIIHWSYLHRRERTLADLWPEFYKNIKDDSWPNSPSLDQLPQVLQDEITGIHGWPSIITDDQRTIWHTNATYEEDVVNTIDCINQVQSQAGQCKIIHSFITDFVDADNRWPFFQLLKQMRFAVIPEVKKIDLARDGYHYDIKTAQSFVDDIVSLGTL
jgi:hypothetical protein